MREVGAFETMAWMDLSSLVRDIAQRYRPGALDTLSARDPAWRAALDRAEREVGQLYEALRDADSTLIRWRQALGELARLWARTGAVEADSGAPSLEQVA